VIAAVQSHDALHCLPDLLSLSLPCFDLSVHDLVKIRQEGLFDEWQRALRRGLMNIQALDDDQLLDPRSARRQELGEYMAAAADDVNMQVRSSSVLRKALTGTTNFGIACAAGALAGATGQSAVAASWPAAS